VSPVDIHKPSFRESVIYFSLKEEKNQGVLYFMRKARILHRKFMRVFKYLEEDPIYSWLECKGKFFTLNLELERKLKNKPVSAKKIHVLRFLNRRRTLI
jgi:RIO-like serine/threonine protein kinase